nr:acyl-CoA dehydrogenase family protein [Candidatus Microthrix sp.]
MERRPQTEALYEEASVRKVLADEHGQAVMELAKDLAGPAGMLTDGGPLGRPVALWHYGYLFARALTVGGGTGEVQRNILGERVLGLPHEPSTS